MSRYDLTGERIDDGDETFVESGRRSRKQFERKGRPIGGLAHTLADLGGKCHTCTRFICACQVAA